jgi:hypothetical protein
MADEYLEGGAGSTELTVSFSTMAGAPARAVDSKVNIESSR